MDRWNGFGAQMMAFRKLLIILVLTLMVMGAIPGTMSAQPTNETDVAIGFFENDGSGLLGDIIRSPLYHNVDLIYPCPQTVYFHNTASYLDDSFDGKEYRIEIYSLLDGQPNLEYQETYVADHMVSIDERITVSVVIHDSDPNPTHFRVGIRYTLFEKVDDHWNEINGRERDLRATVNR